MMAASEIVGMILNVIRLPPILEQHLPPNVMQSTPLVVVLGRSEFVFEFHHG
jgi:hypothetical protein